MEKCLLEGITENTFFGIEFKFKREIFNISISLVTPEFIRRPDRKYSNKHHFFFRGFLNSMKDFDFVGHIGINYRFMKLHPEEASPLNSVMFKDIPSIDAPNSLLISQLSSLPKHHILGVEILNILDPICLQAEVAYINAIWRDYETERYRSWYIQGSLLLTGESRSYDFTLGTLKDPNPILSIGAIEVVARYSCCKIMNEGPLLRGVSSKDGKKKATVFGLNWFISKNLKLQVNYAKEEFTYRLMDTKILTGFGFRMQIAF